MGLCVLAHPEYLYGAPTPLNTNAFQTLAHVGLMWTERGG